MALIEKLNAIGDAIRAKTGGTEKLTLDAMPTEIAAIETGGGEIPEEAFVVRGNCDYRFANGGWNWFIKDYANKITTTNITSCNNMFFNLTMESIPFEINCSDSAVPCKYMFSQSRLKTLPKINNCKPSILQYFCENCYYLREIPADFDDGFDWSNDTNTSRSYQFRNCYSLRAVPSEFLGHGRGDSNSQTYFYYGFNCCYTLDELTDIPFPATMLSRTQTSNYFLYSFNQCSRLKNLTFAMPDGAPYVVKWKNQTIDLTQTVGYIPITASAYITNYNSGITEDKRVYDDVSYQALKDDPDWYATDIAYSRYNHDSAVATINSLPDTSAYLATQSSGTNTIKFKGGSGAYTNGSDVATGGVEYLTEAEIAVAAAKGWTVSIV